MDESNISLKFYEVLKQERNENFFHSLIDIDTCSLHSVHGAIRSGVETTFWGIKASLASAFHLLHDSQPRHEDFEVLQVQTSIHSFFVLQGVLKAT